MGLDTRGQPQTQFCMLCQVSFACTYPVQPKTHIINKGNNSNLLRLSQFWTTLPLKMWIFIWLVLIFKEILFRLSLYISTPNWSQSILLYANWPTYWNLIPLQSLATQTCIGEWNQRDTLVSCIILGKERKKSCKVRNLCFKILNSRFGFVLVMHFSCDIHEYPLNSVIIITMFRFVNLHVIQWRKMMLTQIK
jgi:hypothetical protein